MEQATCKNCNAVLLDAYCHKCGQKTALSRITVKSLWHEVIHSLTHIEKGFFYTTIELFIRPGKVINGYLSGKRVNYHKPFGLYFLWVAAFLLVDGLLKKNTNYVPPIDLSPNDILYEASTKVFPYYEHYIALIILPLVVLTPLISRPLVFKRLGYNYAEVIILSIYIQATGFVIALILEIVGLLTGTYGVIQSNQGVLVVGTLFQSWAVFDIIKRRPYWKSMLLSFTVVVIGYTLFILYLRFAVPFIVSLFM